MIRGFNQMLFIENFGTVRAQELLNFTNNILDLTVLKF